MAKQAGAAADQAGGKANDQGTVDASALQKRIEELEKGNNELKAANAKLTGTMEQFLLGEGQDDDEPKPTKPAKAPDPVADPAGFTAYVEQRADGRVAAVKDELTQQQALERVWQQFKSEHPEIAKHDELVEATAVRQLKEMARSGVKDPIKTLLADPGKFTAKLAESVKAKIDAIRGKPADGEGEGGEDDNARTDGVIGPGMPTVLFAKPGEKRDKPGNFAAELKATQAKMGIF